MDHLLAQVGLRLPGATVTIGNPKGLRPEFTDLSSFVSVALNTIFFPLLGVIFMGVLILGGFDYITSLGDPKKAEAAKAKITNGLIGLVIIILSYWIVQILSYVLRLNVTI